MTAIPTTTELLEDLADIGAEIVAKPHIAFGYRDRLEALRPYVAVAVARPCDGERVIDDFAVMLVIALRQLAGPGRPEAKWLQLAAHLLPPVQEDLKRALDLDLLTIGGRVVR